MSFLNFIKTNGNVNNENEYSGLKKVEKQANARQDNNEHTATLTVVIFRNNCV